MPDGPRYEDDFYAWTQHQAEVVRTMPISDNRFDREHVAEEIEDLGKSERDAVRSQIRRIIEDFLKLAYLPAQAPRFDWMHSISDARATLEDKMSPTLRRDVEGTLERLYAGACRSAALALRTYGEGEAAQGFPEKCPYSLDEICQEDWYPGSNKDDPQTEAI
jgi:hypothetical protein